MSSWRILLTWVGIPETESSSSLLCLRGAYLFLSLQKFIQFIWVVSNSKGYNEDEARMGLRAAYGNMDGAVDYIMRKREEQAALRKQENENRRRQKLQKRLGLTEQGQPVSSDVPSTFHLVSICEYFTDFFASSKRSMSPSFKIWLRWGIMPSSQAKLSNGLTMTSMLHFNL